MTATETKRPEPDVARFKANKHRVGDFYEYSADAVRAKRTLVADAGLFAEMKWLCEEIDRFGGPPEDAAKFKKIREFVARVHDEQGAAVAAGQFVKVRADIFGAWRFLVRSCEAAYARHLDPADRFALGARMPEREVSRIQLDLTDGLGDDEPAEGAPTAGDAVAPVGEKKKKG